MSVLVLEIVVSKKNLDFSFGKFGLEKKQGSLKVPKMEFFIKLIFEV